MSYRAEWEEPPPPIVAPPSVVAAAIAAGASRKNAERLGRIAALVVRVLNRAPSDLGIAELQAELRRLGLDPCSRLVLDPAISAAIAAGKICRRQDGRIGLPFDF